MGSLSRLQKEMMSWGMEAPEQGWKAHKSAPKEALTAFREEGEQWRQLLPVDPSQPEQGDAT